MTLTTGEGSHVSRSILVKIGSCREHPQRNLLAGLVRLNNPRSRPRVIVVHLGAHSHDSNVSVTDNCSVLPPQQNTAIVASTQNKAGISYGEITTRRPASASASHNRAQGPKALD